MTPEQIRDSLRVLYDSRDLESSMNAAMVGKKAAFVSPIIAPESTDLVLLGVHVQKYQPTRSAVNMLDGRDRLDVPAQFGFAVPGFSHAMQNQLARDGSAPGAWLHISGPLSPIVVTHSAASALAINTQGTGNAIASLDVLNMRPVAAWALSQGKTVVIVPDNSDLSRAAAHDAARALGDKVLVAKPAYQPSQHNVMGALIDAYARAAELYPPSVDIGEETRNMYLRRSHVVDARVRLMFDPISEAKPWTPGIGRTASMHELATGAER
ncbi:hypothetical protein [Thiomonas sp.]